MDSKARSVSASHGTADIADLVRDSFDAGFYRESNPDVSGTDSQLLLHYLSCGWVEHRDPCEWFSVLGYLQAYPDVGTAGIDPFTHFLGWGRSEGRGARPSARKALVAPLKAQGATPPGEVNGTFPDVHGYLDYLCPEFAIGWAWCPELPDVPVRVQAVLQSGVVGETEATQFRQDLFDNGVGTGRYGFHLVFDRPLDESEVPVFRSAPGQGGHLMMAGNLSGTSHVQGASGLQPASVEGSVDHIDRWGARGWAWIESEPGESLKVQAVLDGEVIGETLANDFREDLLAHNKGTGRYGYTLQFDRPVVGDRAPTIRALCVAQNLSGANQLPPLTSLETGTRPRGSVDTLLEEHQAFTSPGPDFEEVDPSILEGVDRKGLVVLAYYLPQFHPIPENDQFWGSGFTEWRQLARGISRFPGHYQPRIPRDFGFYDLNDVEVLRRQAELAQGAGVGAFAFYYYWFNGKRVLERPIDAFLKSDVQMPFLLVWANENWTRTWDGSDSELLLRQDYLEEDDDALIDDLARHLCDRRAIRVGDRPLLVIYHPKNIPDAQDRLRRWREAFLSRHRISPLIFMAQTFGEADPSPYGLDGAMEFPPHKLSNTLPGRPVTDAYSRSFTGRVIRYDDFVDVSLGEEHPDYPLVKTAVPSWDNECRRPNRGLTLEGASPAKYERWVGELVRRAMARPIGGVPFVAINAWNEWAEGAYLEPDVHYGAAYLNATARGIRAGLEAHEKDEASSARLGKVSVILPNYNHAAWLPERLRSVIEQSVPPDEIIFLDDASSDESLLVAEIILQEAGIDYRIVPNEVNSGCVFKQWIKGMSLARNELVWIAETDDSAHPDFLKNVLPAFGREDVMASFGHIVCIDENGARRHDLDHYFDGLDHFSWDRSTVVPAYEAFRSDFAVRNVIPNASGLVFRKPLLSEEETHRLVQYKFAGDWYFYALVVRGGSVAYNRDAYSHFRIRSASTSRSAFFTDRHLDEHRMVIEDLRREFAIDDHAVSRHASTLESLFPADRAAGITRALTRDLPTGDERLRICIVAHSFDVGGGEVLPLELANGLKGRGHHVTYMVMNRPEHAGAGLRARLRHDIPVVYWDEVKAAFQGFVASYGIQLINSHNVSVEFNLFLSNTVVPVPYIASLHGGYETVPELINDDFVRFLKPTVSTWLYLSENNASMLWDKGIDRRQSARSFNAVPALRVPAADRAEFRADHHIPEDAFVLVLCSRAIAEKGWDRAVEVAARLQAKASRPVHLVLIGGGPILEQMRKAHREKEFVTFLGETENPSRFFPACDLGLFPSNYSGETFPLFLLECFQAGLPVVSTDIGEIPRIMGTQEDRMPGAMVSYRDSSPKMVKSMARTIAKIIQDYKLFGRLQANARLTSGRFGMDRLLEFYETVFERALSAETETASVPDEPTAVAQPGES